MHQLDTCERDQGDPETLEARLSVRPGLNVYGQILWAACLRLVIQRFGSHALH